MIHLISFFKSVINFFKIVGFSEHDLFIRGFCEEIRRGRARHIEDIHQVAKGRGEIPLDLGNKSL